MSENANVEVGYDIVESPKFTERVQQTFRGTQGGDEMRSMLRRTLARNPTQSLFWNKRRKVGIAELIVPPRLAVWFEVNEEERIVTCTGLGLAL